MTGNAGLRGGAVIKGRYRPVQRGVANLAGLGGRHVRRGHTRGDHAVMATRTGAIHLGVIYRGNRRPTHRRVTSITLIRGIDMGASCFAGGNHAIMTTLTSAQHFIVIHDRGGHPGRRRVAGLANRTGTDVGGRHPTCSYAIVTGDAGLGGGCVIKRTHKPIGRGVANLTSLCGRNVCGALSGGNHTIVTTLTDAQHLCMINQRGNRRPNDTGMTSLANIGGRNMSCGFPGRLTAIMAGDTRVRRGTVIKGRHQPGAHQMTNLARFGGGQMGGALPGGDYAVVAAFATAVHLGVVHRGDG